MVLCLTIECAKAKKKMGEGRFGEQKQGGVECHSLRARECHSLFFIGYFDMATLAWQSDANSHCDDHPKV